jgi:hypothetical protein
MGMPKFKTWFIGIFGALTALFKPIIFGIPISDRLAVFLKPDGEHF